MLINDQSLICASLIGASNAGFRILELPPELLELIAGHWSYKDMHGLIKASSRMIHLVEPRMRRCVKDGLEAHFGKKGSGVVSLSYDEVLSVLGFKSVHEWGPQLGRAHVKRVKQDWWKLTIGDRDKSLLAQFLQALFPFQDQLFKYAKLFTEELILVGTTPTELSEYVEEFGQLPDVWRTGRNVVYAPCDGPSAIRSKRDWLNTLKVQMSVAAYQERIQESIDEMNSYLRTHYRFC